MLSPDQQHKRMSTTQIALDRINAVLNATASTTPSSRSATPTPCAL